MLGFLVSHHPDRAESNERQLEHAARAFSADVSRGKQLKNTHIPSAYEKKKLGIDTKLIGNVRQTISYSTHTHTHTHNRTQGG